MHARFLTNCWEALLRTRWPSHVATCYSNHSNCRLMCRLNQHCNTSSTSFGNWSSCSYSPCVRVDCYWVIYPWVVVWLSRGWVNVRGDCSIRSMRIRGCTFFRRRNTSSTFWCNWFSCRCILTSFFWHWKFLILRLILPLFAWEWLLMSLPRPILWVGRGWLAGWLIYRSRRRTKWSWGWYYGVFIWVWGCY